MTVQKITKSMVYLNENGPHDFYLLKPVEIKKAFMSKYIKKMTLLGNREFFPLNAI